MAAAAVIGHRDCDLLQQLPDIISIDNAIYFKNKIITYNHWANTLVTFVGIYCLGSFGVHVPIMFVSPAYTEKLLMY